MLMENINVEFKNVAAKVAVVSNKKHDIYTNIVNEIKKSIMDILKFEAQLNVSSKEVRSLSIPVSIDGVRYIVKGLISNERNDSKDRIIIRMEIRNSDRPENKALEINHIEYIVID